MSAPNVSYGDPAVALANEILRTTVGSEVHGISIPGTEDHDEMSVFVEPREYVYGLLPETADPNSNPGMPHHIWRTRAEGERSGPGDTDLVCYSLRKFLRMAAKGHPTILLPLFAPQSDLLLTSKIGDALREMRNHFITQASVERFLRYSANQRDRIVSGKKTPNRPELVAAYGFDTKYAAHGLRLAFQGWEVASTGHLSLPMPPQEAAMCLSVKKGQVPKEEVLLLIQEYMDHTIELLESGRCQLPEEPFWPVLSRFSIEAHEQYWHAGRRA